MVCGALDTRVRWQGRNYCEARLLFDSNTNGLSIAERSVLQKKNLKRVKAGLEQQHWGISSSPFNAMANKPKIWAVKQTAEILHSTTIYCTFWYILSCTGKTALRVVLSPWFIKRGPELQPPMKPIRIQEKETPSSGDNGGCPRKKHKHIFKSGASIVPLLPFK